MREQQVPACCSKRRGGRADGRWTCGRACTASVSASRLDMPVWSYGPRPSHAMLLVVSLRGADLLSSAERMDRRAQKSGDCGPWPSSAS